MPKTVNERQRDFKARMREKGFKEVRNLWVPEKLVSAIQAAAKAMRDEHEANQSDH